LRSTIDRGDSRHDRFRPEAPAQPALRHLCLLFVALSQGLHELAGLPNWMSVFTAALISSVLSRASSRRPARIDCMRN